MRVARALPARVRAAALRRRARTAGSIPTPASRSVWAFPRARPCASIQISSPSAAFESRAAASIWSACAAIHCAPWAVPRAVSMPRRCCPKSLLKACARASPRGVARSSSRRRTPRARPATKSAALSAAAFRAASRFAAARARPIVRARWTTNRKQPERRFCRSTSNRHAADSSKSSARALPSMV